MPTIEEFNPGNLMLRPSEVGVESTAAAARRGGGFFNQIAEAKQQTGRNIGSGIASAGEAAVAIEDHREISTGAAKGVQTLYNLEQSKNEAIAQIDPNDPAYGPMVEARLKQWREEKVEPALEQFRSGFNTQKSQAFAEAFIDHTRTSLFHSATADIANAQKVGFQNATKATINTLTNLVTQDPALLEDNLKSLRLSLSASGGALKGVAGAGMMNETIEKASESMVKSAALSAIMKSSDPEATAAYFVKSYPKYINGVEALQFGKAAAGQNKSNAAADRAAENEAHTKQVRDGTAALAKVQTDNVTFDENGNVTINPKGFNQAREIAIKNPAVADHARTLQNYMEAKATEKKEIIKSDPTVKQQLYDGLFSADKPTTDVDLMKANIAGKLSDQDHRRLENLRKAVEKTPLTDPVYKITMDSVKGVLGNTPPGHERYATFVQQFIPAYLRLPPEQQALALNVKDPNSLLSKVMEPLKPSQPQLLMERVMHGDVPPEVLQKIMDAGGTIGGVKPTSIRAGGQVVLPPPDKRTIDQTYETPNGPRIWKGNGWAKPGAQ